MPSPLKVGLNQGSEVLLLLQVEWEEAFCKLENHLLLNLSRCERRLGNFTHAQHLAEQVCTIDAEKIGTVLSPKKE